MASVVAISRFETIPVKKRCSIKTFVAENNLTFKKGRGFYQLNKPETIQDYKEVIVRRKSDKTFISGDKVREILGIPKHEVKFKLDLSEISDFDVFVQSTSVNRILIPGSEFLYEVEENDEIDSSPVKKGAKGATKSSKTPPETTVSGGRSTRSGRGRKHKAEEETIDGTTDEEEKPSTKKKTKTEESDEPAPKTSGRGRRGTKRPSPSSKKEEASEDPTSTKKLPDDVPSATKVPKVDARPPPPGGPVEIVFSFDTTGSMYPCLTQVRRNIAETVKRLQKEISGIRIAIIAHGDYCDTFTYVTNIMDFTCDGNKLSEFVQNVSSTGGGDWEECYELVLHEARTKLSWTPGTQRSLVMIGDAIPHPPSYPLNTLKLDWKKEAKQLYDDLGVRVYAVQALNNSASTSFYRTVADLTSGYHLHLDQFSSITQFIMAICFREQSMDQLQAYEDEMRTKGTGVNRSLHRLFDTLAGRGETTYSVDAGSDELTPVDPSRFQVLDIDERCDIRTFVEKHSLIFKTGRGFYEFTKPEKISDKKEVVLVDKVTGDMYTGPEACNLIGAGGSGRIKPASLEKWRVFVQSTSYNRVLMPNTGFLYEVDPER